MKRIVVLGSTGSIGESTLQVAAALPDRLQVKALAVQSRWVRALEQARAFGAGAVAVADPGAARACAAAAPAGVRVLSGPEGVVEVAAMEGVDMVVCGMVGMAGLPPVMAAAARGAAIAIATKEVLVAAGRIVTRACERTGARLFPVDSEHSAIFQCLEKRPLRHGGVAAPGDAVKRLILTASGGPFAARPEVDLARVTVAQALNHPTWRMGRKVTIDSATLMNKGLEIMEARWLFDVPVDRIDVVVHPESIVHSLVEFVDGNMIAQLSRPDMRFAIQYALTYPERRDGGLPELDLVGAGALRFLRPDPKRFPCLDLAREAGRACGTMPAVLNAANEVAVSRFLAGEIGFAGIWRLVEGVMNRHRVAPGETLDEIVEADAWARRVAAEKD